MEGLRKNVTVFTGYYDRKYIGYSYSLAHIATIVIWTLIIILPACVQFSGEDYWQKA